MAKSIFEKTMQACLESKKPAKVTSKKVTEAKKVVPKKIVKEDEDIDVEVDDIVEDEPEMMDDIADNIVVVVDPEINEEDILSAAEDAQEIIDGTPEGEIPMTDEYVGDLAYTCPICGNTFFSADEMHDGDECPVCSDTPDGFLLVGGIEEPAEAIAEEEEDEVIDDIIDEPEEELEPDMDIADDIIDEPEEESKKAPVRPLVVDESTFNPFMTKFIRENYKNAKSFKVVGAKRVGKRLSLECKIVFKSGKAKKVTLTTEGFKMTAKKLAFYDNGAFKVESSKAKIAPFVFTVSIKNRVIKCEGMKYSLVTKSKTEGKKIQISGNLIRESKRANFQRGRRA